MVFFSNSKDQTSKNDVDDNNNEPSTSTNKALRTVEVYTYELDSDSGYGIQIIWHYIILNGLRFDISTI